MYALEIAMGASGLNVRFFILIPVYKVERYIENCLNSVLRQTYENFIAVMVDDGSPDRSGDICETYCQRDERFTVIHKKNEGLISARRAAINYVKDHYSCDNDYFVFLDSDDWMKLNALETIAKSIADTGCDLLVYRAEKVYEDGKTRPYAEKERFTGIIEDRKQLFMRVYFSRKYNPLCRKAIKCSLMDKRDYSPYYHISRGEDLLQSIPVYEKCARAAFIGESLYYYRMNDESITHSVTLENYAVDTTVRRAALESFEKSGLCDEREIQALKTQMAEVLRKEVILVAGFSAPFQAVVKALQKIREEAFYEMLLRDADVGCLLRLFKGRKYRAVVMFVFARKCIAAGYHWLKR